MRTPPGALAFFLLFSLGGAGAAVCTHARVAVERVAAVQHRLCFAPSSVASPACRLGDVVNLTVALGSVCGIFELDAPRSTDDVRAAYKSERALLGYLDLDARTAPLDLTCASDDKLVVKTSKHGCDYEVNYFTSTDYLTVDDAGRDARVALHATLPPSPPPSPPPPPPPSPHPPYPFSPPPPLAPNSGRGAMVALAVTLSLVGACGCVFACAFAAWRARRAREREGSAAAAPPPPPASAPARSSLVDRVVPRRVRVDVPTAASASSSSSSSQKPSMWKLAAQKLRAPASSALAEASAPSAARAAPAPLARPPPPSASAGRRLPTRPPASTAPSARRPPSAPSASSSSSSSSSAEGLAMPRALLRSRSLETMRARAVR